MFADILAELSVFNLANAGKFFFEIGELILVLGSIMLGKGALAVVLAV